MIMSLRGNQRLLHTRQNLFCLRQRQPQIGDLGKAGGSIDLYQVDTICRDVGACFDQSHNPTVKTTKPVVSLPAPSPQSLDSPRPDVSKTRLLGRTGPTLSPERTSGA